MKNRIRQAYLLLNSGDCLCGTARYIKITYSSCCIIRICGRNDFRQAKSFQCLIVFNTRNVYGRKEKENSFLGMCVRVLRNFAWKYILDTGLRKISLKFSYSKVDPYHKKMDLSTKQTRLFLLIGVLYLYHFLTQRHGRSEECIFPEISENLDEGFQ